MGVDKQIYSHKFILVRKSVRIFYSDKCEPGLKSERVKESSVKVRERAGINSTTENRDSFSLKIHFHPLKQLSRHHEDDLVGA